MSILVCTPMFGGMCHEPYFKSCLNLQEAFINGGVSYDWLTTSNESLITRGRNTSAHEFLKTDFEVLLFIDADIEFTPEDVSKLWNLSYETKQVCVGAYRRKSEDSTKVWIKGELVEIETLSEITEIDFAGTGFMMIPRNIFEALKCDEWRRRDDIYAFFQDDGLDLSEDYFFCQEARKKGFKILCDPSIKLTHWGRFGYGNSTD